MRTPLARRAYPAALGAVSAAIAALAYLLAQPGGHVRRPEPAAADRTPHTAGSDRAEPPPGLARLLSPSLEPEPPARDTPPEPLAVAPPPREAGPPPLDGSAIGAVVRANGGRVPATGAELRQALDRLGDFAQLPVAFSAVALDSGLARPRVVLTPHPGALADAPPDRPNLVGRLFLAANTAPDARTGRPRVTSVEFIAWNTRRAAFDFGVIDGMGGTPVLTVLDGGRCFTCHRTRGPILGVAPWSNTAHDPAVRRAMGERLGVEVPRAKTVGGKRPDDVDGLSLFTPRAADVDRAVRLAGGVLRDREVFRALARAPAGRPVLRRMLVALARPGPLAAADAAAEEAAARADLREFGAVAAAVYQSAPSSRLVDFDPSLSLRGRDGDPPRPLGAWGGAALSVVARYDAERARGNHGLTSDQLPSSPRAFVRPPAPATFAGVAGASVLARTVGLTGPDRRFLADALARASAATRLRPGGQVLPDALAAAVFAGPSFADVLAGGDLPDRDDFKDRFVAGLAAALDRYGSPDAVAPPREYYTSGPRRDPDGAGAAEPAPRTACLRCHDVRGPGRGPGFDPIPPLAFDPFDRAGREAWVREADPRAREAVLGRMLKRVGTDGDMPPTDAAEYARFRAGDPAAFEAVVAFLGAELRKAKGH